MKRLLWHLGRMDLERGAMLDARRSVIKISYKVVVIYTSWVMAKGSFVSMLWEVTINNCVGAVIWS